jgi:hypothetical protein
MRKQGHFSPIGLLIVTATISVIAASAIPDLLRTDIVANELSAFASIRTINAVEIARRTGYLTVPIRHCHTRSRQHDFLPALGVRYSPGADLRNSEFGTRFKVTRLRLVDRDS